jgi:hypothetical protein
MNTLYVGDADWMGHGVAKQNFNTHPGCAAGLHAIVDLQAGVGGAITCLRGRHMGCP